MLTLIPAPVLIVTPTAPAVAAAGLTAVMDVALFTVKLVAAVLPNVTAVAPVRPVPVIATVVPPASGPPAGFRPVTTGSAGAAVYVNWSEDV